MTADTGTQHRLLTLPPSPEVQLDPRQPAVPTNAWATSPEHPVNGVQTQGDPMRPQTPRSRGGAGGRPEHDVGPGEAHGLSWNQDKT